MVKIELKCPKCDNIDVIKVVQYMATIENYYKVDGRVNEGWKFSDSRTFDDDIDNSDTTLYRCDNSDCQYEDEEISSFQ